jgi:hypothetical protein
MGQKATTPTTTVAMLVDMDQQGAQTYYWELCEIAVSNESQWALAMSVDMKEAWHI